MLEGAALLVNKVWFEELPLEALWFANIYDWFGGSAVWYLGVYTFASDITTCDQRASRMARCVLVQCAFVCKCACRTGCPLSINHKKYFSLLNINTNNNNFMFRFDGFEQTAFIIGTALSPIIFKLGGFEAAFRWVNDLFVMKFFVFGHNVQ